MKKKKDNRGGAREGAGRPKTHQQLGLKIPLWAYDWLVAEAEQKGISLYAFSVELLQDAATKGGARPPSPATNPEDSTE